MEFEKNNATRKYIDLVKTLERSEFKDRRMAILGIARTGLAAAPVLRDLGAKVILSDNASAAVLGVNLIEAQMLGVELRVGATPEEALEGAEIVVPSPGIPASAPVLRLALERGLPILSEIEVAYRICRAPIMAVTGTNGKTTTAILLGEIMRAAGYKTYIAGNVAADELKQPLIQAAAEADRGDVIVAEISSFQLEWVEKFRPKIGILTNITPDHMNRHADFREYVRCKSRLFAAQRPDDVAVLNAVNAPSRSIGAGIPSRLCWFDRGACDNEYSSCVRNGQIVVRWAGIEHILCKTDELRIPGAHNLENALAAAAAAIAFGADPLAVSNAMRAFAGVVHRMEFVEELNNIRYYNNSMCTNVDAAIRSLEALDRPVVVIAGGVNKNMDFTPLGPALVRDARHLVLIGRDAKDIENAARASGYNSITHAESMQEAVQQATSFAHPGDAVMLSPACASFDMFKDFEDRGEMFRQAVRQLSYKR